MTEAKPLSAEEIVARLRQYSDPNTDHGIYPLLLEKPEAAAIIATIEQRDEQIKRLRYKLERVIAWLERQASHDEAQAKSCHFETLKKAYIADAKNYRRTAKDLREALAATEQFK